MIINHDIIIHEGNPFLTNQYTETTEEGWGMIFVVAWCATISSTYSDETFSPVIKHGMMEN